MSTGIRIGGTDGKNGAAIVAALKQALSVALQRGQNDVAKSIAANLASLGGASNVNVTGANIQMARDARDK